MPRFAAAAIRAIRAGRGRWVALFLLAALCLPLALPDYSPLARLRLAWLDFYQIALPRERHSEPAVIVEIDERSLRKLGQWPWPRTRLAQLIQRVGDAGAAAIGLDIVMPEPDQASPEALIPRLDPGLGRAVELLSGMPSNDSRLAATMRHYPVVLGLAGADTVTTIESAVLHVKKPLVVQGGELDGLVRNYPQKLVSLPRLQQAASGQGIINADLERGVLRRVPLVSTDGIAPLPALALELERVAQKAQAIVVDVRDGAVSSVRVGKLEVPTQPGGEMWIHFSRIAPDRYLSALDVLQADAGSAALRERLAGKIAIIGITGLAMVDRRINPRGETIPGTDVHAQMIESFHDRRFLRRPAWMPGAEAVTLVVLGGLLIWAVPGMRRHRALFLLAAAILLTVVLGFGLFVGTGLLFDSAGLAVALFVIFSSLVVSALAQADHDRRVSQRSLRAAREAAARVAGELEAARRIQLGILPRSEASFPHERRFDLAAVIEPARMVGGDLYDFFMLDRDRLFFHVADVSGKGIPASLFMSIAKALTKSVALRAGRDADRLLTQVNTELSRDNPESLFVTAFAAILDVASGELRYWTAGHDTPFVYDGRQVRQLDRSQSGPPLCALEGYDYVPQQFQLEPGSLLVLFTDGISEAEDAGGQQYGKERLARCVQSLPAGASAAAALEAVRADVNAFVAGAPASDDFTLLILRWLGPLRPPDAERAAAREARSNAP
jgi:serine phosphatase RsbU (regulator of sigma subunit)/CHASE2 domain-containing sensor protein